MEAIQPDVHTTTDLDPQTPGSECREMIGRSISRYKIISKLGEGGTGVVYQALDLHLNRPVALKFLPPRLIHTPEQIGNLEKEALAISALNHPNIATIYGTDEVDEFSFLVLEYLPGGTLKSRVEQSHARKVQIPLEEALPYAIQIAEGLAHAHAQGIIHRDIKSSNILLTAQRTIKIADFSLASYEKQSDTHLSLRVAGTPSNMSPEQAQGKDLDHRSDIFSFGVVLFELLTGKMPFRGSCSAAILREIVSTPPPSLSQLRPGIPIALESIVTKALQKDREKRYQQVSDLAADLKSVREHLDPRALCIVSPETVTLNLPPRKRRMASKIGLFALLAAASWGAFEMPKIRQNALALMHLVPLPGEKRLVVLSLADCNAPELCDGLMDILSSELTEMEQFQGSLSVISPSEVRKAGVKTPSEAREAFGATLAITGRVQQHGSRLLVLMNLVDTETRAQIRSITIKTTFPDPVSLQEYLVAKATEMLDIALAPNALLALRTGGTPVRGYLQPFDEIERLDKGPSTGSRLRHWPKRSWTEVNSTKALQQANEAFDSASRAVELNGSLTEVRVTKARRTER